MRDHRKLRVFQQADALAVAVYAASRTFARQDPALARQLRRAAVSVAANIVEGSARRTAREYLSYLNVALASASEAQYLLDFAGRLHFIPLVERDRLFEQYSLLLKGLQRLLLNLEGPSPARASGDDQVRGAGPLSSDRQCPEP